MDRNVNSYREAFEDVQSELEVLLEEDSRLADRRGEIKYRTESLRKTGESLGLLLGENVSEEAIGITDAIRELLKENRDTWYSAIAVRRVLRKKEFPVDDYSQPLAVIHTTLKRLQEQEEIKPGERDGKTFYKWDEPFDSGLTDDDIPF